MVNNVVKLSLTFADLAKAHVEQTESFVADCRKHVVQFATAKVESDNARKSRIVLGLHTAVLADNWNAKSLQSTPEWFGRDILDYLSHTFKLKKDESIPRKVLDNGQVVLCLCKADENGKQQLTETEYMELKQPAINALHSVLKFYKFSTAKALENPLTVNAINMAKARQEGYVKKLAELATQIVEPETATADTSKMLALPVSYANQVCEFLKKAPDRNADEVKAVCTLAFEIMDILTLIVPDEIRDAAAEAYKTPDYLAEIEKAREAAKNADTSSKVGTPAPEAVAA